jgi:hypothetical protein
VAVAALAATWLIVLPRLAQQPGVNAYILRNEALGIDPSAKFYTELPAMPGLVDRVDAARRQHASAFWQINDHRDCSDITPGARRPLPGTAASP